MLKNAARAWGYPETEAENNFDPLVAMLLAACSTELEKISDEIHASRARVLERLVQLLSPDVLTGALPAHAIAAALPAEPAAELSADAQFYTPRKMPAVTDHEEPAWKDVFFSPTASFHLNRASVRFMATGNQLYRISHAVSKETIAYCGPGKELPPSRLLLAIDEPGVNLHKSQFYFDFRNEADRNLFFHQLPMASWWLDDRQLQHSPGYGNQEISGESLDLRSILNRDYDVNGKIKKHINAYYKRSFITVYDEAGHTTRKEAGHAIPAVISESFSGKELALLQKQPLRWISVQFPETIPNRLLQDTVCMMNCFPVMNSRLNNLNYRLREIVNIIPLQSEELFLDLEEVSDDEGKILNIRSLGLGEEESVAILMRNGGVGRFDERDATAIVEYVLQLLRDDSAAFSALGNDFMNNEMKQLQQIINRLEQRLVTSQSRIGQTPYLIVKNNQKRPWHNLLIRYWSTNGMEANNIKSGTALQLYKGGSLDGNGAVLVTTTHGGRNKLSTTETVLAYKTALLSKDRLITPEDIKTFCYYQLGDRVNNVAVRKGVMTHPDQQQGFAKTIDVFITINKKAYGDMLENGELSFWPENLKFLISEKSGSLMPYRVFIDPVS